MDETERALRQTDRLHERSHYRRQLAKYFVWVELFSRVFIQSETLPGKCEIIARNFRSSGYGVRQTDRQRERCLQGVEMMLRQKTGSEGKLRKIV